MFLSPKEATEAALQHRLSVSYSEAQGTCYVLEKCPCQPDISSLSRVVVMISVDKRIYKVDNK